jgi:hypothetical protein
MARHGEVRALALLEADDDEELGDRVARDDGVRKT